MASQFSNLKKLHIKLIAQYLLSTGSHVIACGWTASHLLLLCESQCVKCAVSPNTKVDVLSKAEIPVALFELATKKLLPIWWSYDFLHHIAIALVNLTCNSLGLFILFTAVE